MNCTDCPAYSYSLRRCKEGKINPRTIKGCVEAIRFFGPNYICNMCTKKGKALKRCGMVQDEFVAIEIG